MLSPCGDVVIPLILVHHVRMALLQNGDLTAVTFIIIFTDSATSVDFESMNSPLLSVNNFSGAPDICIHDLKIALRMTYGSSELTKLDTDSLVA